MFGCFLLVEFNSWSKSQKLAREWTKKMNVAHVLSEIKPFFFIFGTAYKSLQRFFNKEYEFVISNVYQHVYRGRT